MASSPAAFAKLSGGRVLDWVHRVVDGGRAVLRLRGRLLRQPRRRARGGLRDDVRQFVGEQLLSARLRGRVLRLREYDVVPHGVGARV